MRSYLIISSARWRGSCWCKVIVKVISVGESWVDVAVDDDWYCGRHRITVVEGSLLVSTIDYTVSIGRDGNQPYTIGTFSVQRVSYSTPIIINYTEYMMYYNIDLDYVYAHDDILRALLDVYDELPEAFRVAVARYALT